MKSLHEQSQRVLSIRSILCADWGKEHRKRAVYAADVPTRSIYRVPSTGAWSVAELLQVANKLSQSGPVLVAIDAPLGVPTSYLSAASLSLQAWSSPASFIELLHAACETPKFFDATTNPSEWKTDRPFFAVPPREGGLTSYIDTAALQGVDLRRAIDKLTKAKTLFAKSGIPGSVGSATCSLWQELGVLLKNSRSFAIWPFEGDLETLLDTTQIVFGETYPRAAYSTALLDQPVVARAPLALAKTDMGVRHTAVRVLQAAQWIAEHGVQIDDLDFAERGEDDFDACLTAAALLRCVIENYPLSGGPIDRIEGGILGTGSINLALKEKTSAKRADAPGSSTAVARATRELRCPIDGCDKVYHGSRSGWDAHVASVKAHPSWHSELLNPASRKNQFRTEFPEFFS